ncbi:hypothetical protein [Novosphingobium sp. THN1]|uniref:hypothetical protein n=1 Tax=Novosphingobium sp. THN1 TaxID=1016987 RepID=UPI0013C32E99|nr:hypothetical protein [Novosphingobium sp. THN1]
MTHLTIHEWGHVRFGDHGLTRAHAHALHAAACEHPLAHEDATNILVLGRDRIIARQMVGMVSAKGCSLEILPKVDPDTGSGRATRPCAAVSCGCSMLLSGSTSISGPRPPSPARRTPCSKS